MPSNARERESSADSSPDSPAETMEPVKLMDWNEWERWMSKLQSRGLRRFLNRYVKTKKIDIDKFLANVDFTIVQANLLMTDQPNEISKIQSLIKIERSLIKFLKVRKKLPEYNTIDDAVSLIQRSKKILILTGAGISTSCGIPDFRSENGLYSQLEDYDGLDDVYDMFDLKFFKSNPEPFYKFLKNIFPFSSTTKTASSSLEPKSIDPSDSHRFVKLVESNSKLLRNYTQNIDTLEMRAGVQKLIQCHGSFAKFTCLKCKGKYPGSQFEDLISQAKVVLCPSCSTSSPRGTSAECQPSSKKRRKTNSGARKSVDTNDKDGHPKSHDGRSAGDHGDDTGEQNDGADNCDDGADDHDDGADDRGDGADAHGDGVDGHDDDDDDDDPPGIDWVSLGLMKPDITFFGEDLPREFDEAIDVDRFECDLLIVIGTSLKVAPVSEIIKFVPRDVPQILINRDPIYPGKSRKSSRESGRFDYDGDEFEFDIYLFGDSDVILRELSFRLGPQWKLPIKTVKNDSQDPSDHPDQQCVDGSHQKIEFNPYNQSTNHVWLFPGSNSSHSWFGQWDRNEDRNSTSSESEPE